MARRLRAETPCGVSAIAGGNMDKENSELEFLKNELINYQKSEPLAVERLKTAQANLAKAKTELAEAKEYLSGIRGGINVFVSEIQRLEKKTAQ